MEPPWQCLASRTLRAMLPANTFQTALEENIPHYSEVGTHAEEALLGDDIPPPPPRLSTKPQGRQQLHRHLRAH
jgi:hypothetical protein